MSAFEYRKKRARNRWIALIKNGEHVHVLRVLNMLKVIDRVKMREFIDFANIVNENDRLVKWKKAYLQEDKIRYSHTKSIKPTKSRKF